MLHTIAVREINTVYYEVEADMEFDAMQIIDDFIADNSDIVATDLDGSCGVEWDAFFEFSKDGETTKNDSDADYRTDNIQLA